LLSGVPKEGFLLGLFLQTPEIFLGLWLSEKSQDNLGVSEKRAFFWDFFLRTPWVLVPEKSQDNLGVSEKRAFFLGLFPSDTWALVAQKVPGLAI